MMTSNDAQRRAIFANLGKRVVAAKRYAIGKRNDKTPLRGGRLAAGAALFGGGVASAVPLGGRIASRAVARGGRLGPALLKSGLTGGSIGVGVGLGLRALQQSQRRANLRRK